MRNLLVAHKISLMIGLMIGRIFCLISIGMRNKIKRYYFSAIVSIILTIFYFSLPCSVFTMVGVMTTTFWFQASMNIIQVTKIMEREL